MGWTKVPFILWASLFFWSSCLRTEGIAVARARSATTTQRSLHAIEHGALGGQEQHARQRLRVGSLPLRGSLSGNMPAPRRSHPRPAR